VTALAGFLGETVEVAVTVELEQTPESLHAYAVPEGIDIRPGDSVLVHGAPSRIGFGERKVVECRATVTRAGWLERRWTRFAALFALTELYEVGFQPRHEIALRPRSATP
jgi:hypothetical protein